MLEGDESLNPRLLMWEPRIVAIMAFNYGRGLEEPGRGEGWLPLTVPVGAERVSWQVSVCAGWCLCP